MQCRLPAKLYSIVALLFVFCSLLAGCGDSPPTPAPVKLAESIQIPTPTDRPSAELKVIEQDNQAAVTPSASTDANAIQWNETSDHIGQSMLVCGPVAGTRYASTTKGAPTFINLGVDYPNSQRFTIVIWGRDRAKFDAAPEQYYKGKTLCVGGVIESYRNVTQIQVNNQAQIEVK